MEKACVIGAGSWGTALGMVLLDRGFQVTLLARSARTASLIEKERILHKLPGIRLPDGLKVEISPEKALEGASLVVSAVPSDAVSEVATKLAPLIPKDAYLVSVTKGFDVATNRRASEVWEDQDVSLKNRMGVLSGPNFAIEVARKLPSATVVASRDEETREWLQQAFMTGYFRVYSHWDVLGVELGGALKNIIALACGMTEGMGLGYNAQAGIISRGIAEIARLGVALGADRQTFAGLSGLGDLVLTSTGYLSRNRQAGIAIGKGEAIESFLARTGYTVEGLNTVKVARVLAREKNVEMPISDVVYKVLYEGLPVREGLELIMKRERRPEHETSYA